jgi:hypothetical protein
LEPEIRDFMRGGVNLMMFISSEFLFEDDLSLLDLGDILSDTGSDEVVLKPAIRSFNLASGLGRKGVNDLHIAILQNLLPLRGGFIGEEVMFVPEGISSPDKSKDRVRIDVVGVRESVLEDEGLEGQDMGPVRFFLDQNGIEHESAIIIYRSNQVPFLLRGGGPEMVRSIVLNEFSGIMG